MRWRMCRRCGVKLQPDVEDESIIMERCPICKGAYLTIKARTPLMRQLEKLAVIRSKSIMELLEEAVDRLREVE